MVRGKAAKRNTKPNDVLRSAGLPTPSDSGGNRTLRSIGPTPKVEPIVTLERGVGNLKYRLYEGQWEKLPNLDQLEPIAEGTLPKGNRSEHIKRKEKYGMVFTGILKARRLRICI